MTSQLAPSSAYATTRPTPQNRLNGVIQSSCEPPKVRPMTGKPEITAPTTMPWQNVATIEPPINALSQKGRCAGVALKRNSNATPRKIRPMSINVNGMVSASIITAYARGNAPNNAAPPRTSQVSLPSQTGATLFTITSRSSASRTNGNRMPMPRSKPSITMYISVAKTIMTNQITDRSTPINVTPLMIELPQRADEKVCRAKEVYRR